MVGDLNDDVLGKAFDNEYARINKILLSGKLSESDICELKDIRSQAQIYGVDDDLLNRLTSLRLSIGKENA